MKFGIQTAVGARSLSIEQARTRLARFRNSFDDRTMVAALMAGGLRIQNRWKELIRERFFETGTYERSVHMEPGEGAEVLLGTDIIDPPYPYYGEFGTAKMEARPTARPAMDEAGGDAFDDFVRALDMIASRELA